MKDLNVYIGKKMKEYRENRKLTQEYMAKELDVATNHYGRIERGENACTLHHFITICNLLSIEPNQLVGNLVTIHKDNINSHFDKLSDKNKQIVKKMIEYLGHSQ